MFLKYKRVQISNVRKKNRLNLIVQSHKKFDVHIFFETVIIYVLPVKNG